MNIVSKEAMHHGTFDFNFASYPHGSEPGLPLRFGTHWHDEYEIIYVREGEFQFLADGRLFSVGANQALIIDQYCIHSFSACQPGVPAHYTCFVFGFRFLFPDPNSRVACEWRQSMENGNRTITQLITGSTPSEQTILSSLQAVDQLCEGDSPQAFPIQIQLLSVFSQLFLMHAFLPRPNHVMTQSEIIKKSLLLIHQTYHDPISVTHIAESLNISLNHFIRLFSVMVGSTPKQYIQNLRIQYAIHLIRTEHQLPISEIASRSGFDDNNYFSRVFRRKVGVSPSEFARSRMADSD